MKEFIFEFDQFCELIVKHICLVFAEWNCLIKFLNAINPTNGHGLIASFSIIFLASLNYFR